MEYPYSAPPLEHPSSTLEHHLEYPGVPRSTLEYPQVPLEYLLSTLEYPSSTPGVPSSTPEYPLLRSTCSSAWWCSHCSYRSFIKSRSAPSPSAAESCGPTPHDAETQRTAGENRVRRAKQQNNPHGNDRTGKQTNKPARRVGPTRSGASCAVGNRRAGARVPHVSTHSDHPT